MQNLQTLVDAATEAEQALIAAALIDGRVAARAIEVVPDAAFCLDHHQQIWARLRASCAIGQAVTPLMSLKPWLIENKFLEYAHDLAGSVISVTQWRHYADLVMRNYTRICAVEASEAIRAVAFDSNQELTCEQIAERVQEIAFGLSASGHISTGGNLVHIVDGAEEYLASLNVSSSAPGIMTGVTRLDQMLGGLRGGHLCCIGARPGMGKSAMLLTMLRQNPDAAAAVYSLEMGHTQVLQRWVAAELDISVQRQQAGQISANERAAIVNLIEALRGRHTFVSASTRLTVERVRAQVERLHAKRPLSVVMIDYLGLLQESRGDNRNLAVAHISRELKLMAVELNVPVIALHQLNRGSEQRSDKRPMLSDLRDSGAIEQDCDQVVFIHRPGMTDFKPEPNPRDFISREGYVASLATWHDAIERTELVIAKNRHGAAGVAECRFVPNKFQFTNWE